MTWGDYNDANKLKGRSSKKAREEHERAVYAAWWNLYERPQNKLLNEVNNILSQKSC